MGKVRKSERKSNIDEIRSIKLKTSPPRRNRLFKKSRMPQKTKKVDGGAIPKTSIKNPIAAAKSIKPNIPTKILFTDIHQAENYD